MRANQQPLPRPWLPPVPSRSSRPTVLRLSSCWSYCSPAGLLLPAWGHCLRAARPARRVPLPPNWQVAAAAGVKVQVLTLPWLLLLSWVLETPLAVQVPGRVQWLLRTCPRWGDRRLSCPWTSVSGRQWQHRQSGTAWVRHRRPGRQSQQRQGLEMAPTVLGLGTGCQTPQLQLPCLQQHSWTQQPCACLLGAQGLAGPGHQAPQGFSRQLGRAGGLSSLGAVLLGRCLLPQQGSRLLSSPGSHLRCSGCLLWQDATLQSSPGRLELPVEASICLMWRAWWRLCGRAGSLQSLHLVRCSLSR